MTRKLPILFGTFLLLGAGACKKEPAPAAPAATPPAPPAAPAPAAAAPAPAAAVPAKDPVVSFTADPHRHMKEHFARATQMQDAVLAGNLGQAQVQARWLASHKEETPESWRPYARTFQSQASVVADAKTIEEAAAGIGRMAATCGDCHAAHKAKPNIGSTPIVGKAGSVKEHMTAQLEALDRLWDGLMIPSDQAWGEGAKLLAKVAVPQKSLQKEGLDKADSATVLAESLRTLSASAAKATTKGERSTTYAELLTTCVACHVSVRNPIRAAAAAPDPGAK
jgi:cytochrome c553